MSVFRRSPAFAFAVALGLAAPGLAEAQHAAKSKAPQHADEAPAEGAGAAVDRDTGKLRAPTRDELQELAAGARAYVSQSTEGLLPRVRADGSVVVDLEGRFQSVAIARRVDGKTVVDCATSPEEVDRLLGTAPAAPRTAPVAEEK